MLQQTKQASIASAMRASKRSRLSIRPKHRPYRFFPNFPVNSAIGLLFGLLLSAWIAIARERSDRALQQPGDIKLWANLTELGTIPSTSTKSFSYYAKRTSSQARSRIGDVPARAELMTLEHKPSAVAEAFRSALTSIFFISEHNSRPGVLIFTSAIQARAKPPSSVIWQ